MRMHMHMHTRRTYYSIWHARYIHEHERMSMSGAAAAAAAAHDDPSLHTHGDMEHYTRTHSHSFTRHVLNTHYTLHRTGTGKGMGMGVWAPVLCKRVWRARSAPGLCLAMARRRAGAGA
jgi:hypothetical protein